MKQPKPEKINKFIHAISYGTSCASYVSYRSMVGDYVVVYHRGHSVGNGRCVSKHRLFKYRDPDKNERYISSHEYISPLREYKGIWSKKLEQRIINEVGHGIEDKN